MQPHEPGAGEWWFRHRREASLEIIQRREGQTALIYMDGGFRELGDRTVSRTVRVRGISRIKEPSQMVEPILVLPRR